MSGGIFSFVGSLIAVALLVAVVWHFRLGAEGARLPDEAEARELAESAICGFDAIEVAMDAAGRGALLRDAKGRILLLRPHGMHFAARLLDPSSAAKLHGAILTVGVGKDSFAPTTLDLGNAAEAWERRIRALRP